jgi:hypothetical protein
MAGDGTGAVAQAVLDRFPDFHFALIAAGRITRFRVFVEAP